MTGRTSIPEELRRRVLIEAGHRCAIHTCKNPDVDVHHIVPWEKCQEHTFENLIALCPNCHRRSHAGKIDQKSLLLYKTRLATFQQTRIDDTLVSTEEQNLNWESRTLSVEEKSKTKFSVEIEYPHFISTKEDYLALNALLEGEAYSSLLAERTSAGEFDASPEGWWTEMGNSYTSSFHITLFKEDIISISTSLYTYGAGAAHGNHATFGKNYFLNPLRSFNLQDLFSNPSDALSKISSFCVYYLEFENHDAAPNEWVRSGAGPAWKNFSSFYLTSSELVIVFQPYEVGCYAEGQRLVPLSSRFLSPILVPGSPLANLFG